MLGHAVHPEDILLWTDGFWCFRNEKHKEFMRNDNYRAILRLSKEWVKLSAEFPRSNSHTRSKLPF